MKIFIVAEFSKGALGVSYSRAFKKCDCEVVEFDISSKTNSFFPLLRKINLINLNKALLSKVINTNPDLVFIIKGAFIFPETLDYIKTKIKTTLFCFNPDNPFNQNKGASNDLIRESIPHYDGYLIWGKFLIPELLRVGAKNVEYLPFACDQELHYPIQTTEEEKRIFGSDLAFIGSYDKEREEFLLNLLEYDLAIWGNGWNKLSLFSPLRKMWKGRNVMGEDFSRVCNTSKIILNHIRNQNGDAHNMRTFEVPACKGFMLTPRTKGQCEFFEEGKEIICFETIDELKKTLRKYLPQDNVREEIRTHAYKKAQEYTYDRRAKHILKIFQKPKETK